MRGVAIGNGCLDPRAEPFADADRGSVVEGVSVGPPRPAQP